MSTASSRLARQLLHGGFIGSKALDTRVPLYGAVHGGVQAVSGP